MRLTGRGAPPCLIAHRYLTYLGGSGHDSACAISRGADGHVWVGGVTQSTDLPVSDGAQGKTRGGGGSDGLLACIEPNGHLGYLSYVSGQVRAADTCRRLLLDNTQRDRHFHVLRHVK